MKRLNSNTSLTQAPRVKKGRSRFDLSHTNHMDFGVGLLYPLDRPWEVIPGDTFDAGLRSVIRISQPLKISPMDTLCCDVNFFFTPYRLVFEGWNDFITGNTGTSWNTVSTTTLPQVRTYLDPTESSVTGMQPGGLLDYLGIPPHSGAYNATGTPTYFLCNALFPRAYYTIWNWYWRYEPLMQEALVNTGSTNEVIDTSSNPTYVYGVPSNKLCPVVRLADYFTRCLPAPQKGPDVALDLSLPESLYSATNLQAQVLLQGGSSASSLSADTLRTDQAQNYVYGDTSKRIFNASMNQAGSRPVLGFYHLFGGSINGLREAFTIQKIREIDALYGQRIDGYTEGHYGVTPPTIAFKPEYLGGKRFEINFNQVVQTSDAASATSTELGEIGGYSFTKHEAHYFTKSFTEFGCIMPLICVRVKHHSYAQGIDRVYMKSTRFDFWEPSFSNMADMGIVRNELYVDSTFFNYYTLSDYDVFGYQERGAEYKYMPNRVSGLMRPQVNGTLDVWTFTDEYASAPSLSPTWICEPTDIIDRSLYIPSTTANPFIGHFYFDVKAYRELPYHSIPGGLTHQF